MSIFDPHAQINRAEYKIVVALERLSEAFRVLFWEKGKALGLSPIQIKFLIFLLFHPREQCTVSGLAQAFNLTPSTVSEALKALERKELLQRRPNPEDTRSRRLMLTDKGTAVARQLANFADVMVTPLTSLATSERDSLLEGLFQLIVHLQREGVITPQRMCFVCTYYRKTDSGHFCNLIRKPLEVRELRIDCPEHAPRRQLQK
ncbi:MAG: MarR family transcriptional regulator [Saprospiraceae bacterium]|nr:MarR family transcriptional regulator [Saprospiraceae bacterium]MDW8484591.1 MarR family transcriptional regulator [Saprospiraceae bacterium]